MLLDCYRELEKQITNIVKKSWNTIVLINNHVKLVKMYLLYTIANCWWRKSAVTNIKDDKWFYDE